MIVARPVPRVSVNRRAGLQEQQEEQRVHSETRRYVCHAAPRRRGGITPPNLNFKYAFESAFCLLSRCYNSGAPS